VATTSSKKTADSGTKPPGQFTSGADVVVQTLVNHGVDTVFAYPGGASMPLHQALTRFRDRVRVVLPRHEQGGGFAAQGYSRSTGKVGVCCVTTRARSFGSVTR
jgi:acetolactate synthase-1/2/3 large subunit